MSEELNKIQEFQEEEYSFPYHYASNYYPKFSTGFIDSWAMNYNLSIEMILKLIEEETPKSIVDIGCGDGRLTTEIFKQFPNVEVKGIDYSKRAITLAKAMQPSIDFEIKDITAKESNIKKYSMGILMEVFEHIEIELTHNFAYSVSQLIKDQGLLIVTVPHLNKTLEYKHFQHFSTNSLNQYFLKYFSIEKIIYIEKRGIINKILNKLIVNSLFVLNNSKLLNFIYRLYENWVFNCKSEKNCSRIAVCYRKK